MKLKSTEELKFTQQTLRAFRSFLIPIRIYSDGTTNPTHSKYSSRCILLRLMIFIPSSNLFVEWHG